MKPGDEGDRLKARDLVLEGGSPQRPPVEGENGDNDATAITNWNEIDVIKGESIAKMKVTRYYWRLVIFDGSP